MSHRRVDGRGRHGKEYGNTLVQRRTDKEGRRAVSPRGLQSLQKRMDKCHRNLPNPHVFKGCVRLQNRQIESELKVRQKGRVPS